MPQKTKKYILGLAITALIIINVAENKKSPFFDLLNLKTDTVTLSADTEINSQSIPITYEHSNCDTLINQFAISGSDTITIAENGHSLVPNINNNIINCENYNFHIPSGITVTTKSLNSLGIYLKVKNIQIDGIINADGQGFTATQGTGAGQSGNAGAGGANGGDGAGNSYGNTGGKSYGSTLKPETPGSGGGNGLNGTGGAGGGAIKIYANDKITINGNVTANGIKGSTNTGGYRDGGGGAGGSIWLQTLSALEGTGFITANGGGAQTGDCCNGPGGGGGGRVAIYYETNNSTISAAADGGDGWKTFDGQDGTAVFIDINGNINEPTVHDLYIYTSFELVNTDAQNNTFNFNSLNINGNARTKPAQIRIEEGNTKTINLTKEFSQTDAEIILETNTEINIAQGDFTILQNNKNTSIYGLNDGKELNLKINVLTGKLTIHPVASIDLTGDGFSNSKGTGTGQNGNAGTGGGHGNDGAANSYGNTGGKSYGSALKPETPGSGGGNGLNGVGGAGGGSIKIFANRGLAIHGSIYTNGRDGSTNTGGYRDGGGGAGGSIWLQTLGTLEGAGIITANGGKTQTNDCCNGPGGGSGGRIAIYYEQDLSSLQYNATANGGDGWRDFDGQTGTVGFFKINGDLNTTSGHDLYVYKTYKFSDSDSINGLIELKTLNSNKAKITSEKGIEKTIKTTGSANIIDSQINLETSTNFLIGENFTMSKNMEETSIYGNDGQKIKLNITTEGNFNLSPETKIDLSGDGHPAAQGESMGLNGNAGSGGAHGGDGAANSYGNAGRKSYGKAVNPETFGSGGGNGLAGLGGTGGGVINLEIKKDAIINGMILTNGNNGSTITAGYRDGGGGAGGSIKIKVAQNLSGNGSIISNGGKAKPDDCCNGSGGGGGGRIAIFFKNYAENSNTLHQNSIAQGGDGWKHLDGQAGTVGFFKTYDTENTLDLQVYKTFEFTNADSINNTWNYNNIKLNGANVRVEQDISPKTINLTGDFIFTDSLLALETGTNFIIEKNGIITSNGLETSIFGYDSGQKITLNMTVKQNFDLGANSKIDLSGDGYPAAQGPGAGSNGNAGSGGSYGGKGSINSYKNSVKEIYGSSTGPIDFGSGGGNGLNGPGGAGGGAFKAEISGIFTINGLISTNGGNGSKNTAGFRDGGGGSGGSVFIKSEKIQGNGSITANGGGTNNTDCCNGGGGGGGGRIAVYYKSLGSATELLKNIISLGGDGWKTLDGEAGSVIIKETPNLITPEITFENTDSNNLDINPAITSKLPENTTIKGVEWKISTENNCETDKNVWESGIKRTGSNQIKIDNLNGKFINELNGKTALNNETNYFICTRYYTDKAVSLWSVPSPIRTLKIADTANEQINDPATEETTETENITNILEETIKEAIENTTETENTPLPEVKEILLKVSEPIKPITKEEWKQQFSENFNKAEETITTRKEELQTIKDNANILTEKRLEEVKILKEQISEKITEQTVEQVKQIETKKAEIKIKEQELSIREEKRTINAEVIGENITKKLAEKITKLEETEKLEIIVDFKKARTTNLHILENMGEIKRQIGTSVAIEVTPETAKFLADSSNSLNINIIEDFDLLLHLDTASSLIGAAQILDQPELNFNGSNIRIAVLDTGINKDHPSLKDQIIEQVDFTGEGIGDFNGHGTHIASIIAGTDPVFRGIAPGAKLLDIKIIKKDGSGKLSDALAGIEWAIKNKADIINFSSGGEIENCDGSDLLSQAVEAAIEQGITVVSSAGNLGPDPDTITTPGCTKQVITVGAVNKNLQVESFTSRTKDTNENLKPDLFAPGSDITAAWLNDKYATLSGTSQAAPFTSGAIALLMEANSDLSPIDIKYVLKSTSAPLTEIYPNITEDQGVLDILSAIHLYQGLAMKEEVKAQQTENKTETEKDPLAIIEKEFQKAGKILKDCLTQNKDNAQERKNCSNQYLKTQVKLQIQKLNTDDKNKINELKQKAVEIYKLKYQKNEDINKKLQTLGSVLYHSVFIGKSIDIITKEVDTLLESANQEKQDLKEQLNNTIKVYFREKEKANLEKYKQGIIPFKDTEDNEWYFYYIQKLKDKNYISGYKDENGNNLGEFRPANNITIAEALRVILEASGHSQDSNTDLNDENLNNHWAKGYFQKAQEINLSITEEMKLNPNRPITRYETIQLLLEAFEIPIFSTYKHIFEDVPLNGTESKIIHTASSLGIISGDIAENKITFRPNEPLNRAEIAKIIVESEDLLK